MQMPRRLPRYVLLGLLAAVAVWAHQSLDLSPRAVLQQARAAIEASGPLGPLIFVGVCVAGAVLHAPELVVVALGGVLFGKAGGILYGWIGATLGATATFLLARYLLRDWVQANAVRRFPRLRRLDEQFRVNGFVTVMLLRAAFFLSPPVNWVIGASQVGVGAYLAGSALGLLPGVVLTVAFADEVIAMESWRELLRPPLLAAAGAAAACLGAVALAVRRMLGPARHELPSDGR